jgi:hypothetical protein
MSSLIFDVGEKHALVATDSLVVNSTGRPHRFTSKARYLPHIHTIIAATGIDGLLGRFQFAAGDLFALRGIDHLNELAPTALAALWADVTASNAPIPPELGNLTTTVYMFGFSEVTGLIHCYVYRSASGFKSERLQYGLHGKPEWNHDPKMDLMAIMRSQREIQAQTPAGEMPLYIGGEIQVHDLTEKEMGERGCSVYTAARFDDYEDEARVIFGK